MKLFSVFWRVKKGAKFSQRSQLRKLVATYLKLLQLIFSKELCSEISLCCCIEWPHLSSGLFPNTLCNITSTIFYQYLPAKMDDQPTHISNKPCPLNRNTGGGCKLKFIGYSIGIPLSGRKYTNLLLKVCTRQKNNYLIFYLQWTRIVCVSISVYLSVQPMNLSHCWVKASSILCQPLQYPSNRKALNKCVYFLLSFFLSNSSIHCQKTSLYLSLIHPI